MAVITFKLIMSGNVILTQVLFTTGILPKIREDGQRLLMMSTQSILRRSMFLTCATFHEGLEWP